ncbi:MAG TPA: preprotein translocase subunit SecE [Saprospiraceae bacterium]|nr:preprotein translocase subunit SecE [Saprospiraceae bacterium]
MDNLLLYVKDSYNELIHKVTWPTWPELLNSTVVVLVASVIIALIIFIMDLISKNILTTIYSF